MKCEFCEQDCNSTVRDNNDVLHNCCIPCKDSKKLIISVVYKPKEKEN